MAQKVITQLIDDLDGSEIVNGDGETITFALDGNSYEIDLTAANAEQLRGALSDYLKAARRTGGNRKRAKAP